LAAAALTCALWLPALAAETVTLRPWCGVTFILTLGEEDPIFIDGTGAEKDLTGWPLVYMDDGRTRSLATAARQELTIRHGDRLYDTYTSRLEPLTAAFRRLGRTSRALGTACLLLAWLTAFINGALYRLGAAPPPDAWNGMNVLLLLLAAAVCFTWRQNRKEQ